MSPALLAVGGAAWLATAFLAALGIERLRSRKGKPAPRPAARNLRGRQLGEFLGYVLFSVREYLTSVSSVTEQIALSSKDPALKELGSKLLRIVAELNGKLARMMESAQNNTLTRPKTEEFDLRELLCACLDEAAVASPDHAARARLEADAGLPRIAGDRETIACVLLSALTNALEALAANGPGGVLKVSARPGEDCVLVEVYDEGGGIPEGFLDKAFTPLFTTKTASGGLGLGLSMSRRMIERCGGALSLRSAGGRTTAQIRIPLRPALPVIRGNEATWPARRKSA